MAKPKFEWMRRPKKSDPEAEVDTPINLGNHSNGEFFKTQTPQDKAMRDEIFRRADEQSRYLGMERREFMASTMGMATTLAVINQIGTGCSNLEDKGLTMDGGTTAATGAESEVPYLIPPEAMCEDLGIFDGDEFIFDVQTHSFDDGEWREKFPFHANSIETPAPFTCDEVDQLDCYDKDHYGELMFVDSDTTMSVITSWPGTTCGGTVRTLCGLPLSNEGMAELRDWINSKAMSQRVLNQIQVMPNDRIEFQKEVMTMAHEELGAASWKAYPAWRNAVGSQYGAGEGYFLTDDIGRDFIEHGMSLGLNNFAIHKGLPILDFDMEHNQPHDIGPAAREYPDANFVVFHSAISAGTNRYLDADRVPYDPDEINPTGVNQLIRTVLENDVANKNVYGELGTTWAIISTDPTAAQHTIGKLLKYLGENNVVWGTDSILNGSPQGQIESFRRFQISVEYQDRYGYPEITDEIRRKIFGLNAAKVYRIDPDAERCKANASIFADIKRKTDAKFGKRRWTAKKPMAPRTPKEFMAYAKREIAKGSPG